ncbi:hypothetical protein O181_075713 [Austropuccinia psidii MF-1]|uniref:CCZ1/INTU/HSP4 first Longin domain-containing protein n=1 Tax=Austropuccinia psidii MF-1 TaxID=1389203 RepID=A0A9Q3F9F1_9BASI|nr:hypothetical protein [Austropuccinia psidii MF-1]
MSAPSLSSFLIWSNQVQHDKHLINLTHQINHDSKQDQLPHSVLYFLNNQNPTFSHQKTKKLIGLIQGIINFTSILSLGLQNPSHSTPKSNLRALHTSNQLFLFIEPEPSFHLCANSSFNPTPHPSNSSPQLPSETVLLNYLSSGIQEYHLLNGSMSRLSNNRHDLVKRLERFWSVWLWRWNVEKTGCGAIDFDEYFGALQSHCLQLPPLPGDLSISFDHFINQICPNSLVLPIFIHRRHVVHLPNPSDRISHQDIKTLVKYLLSLLSGSEAKSNLHSSNKTNNHTSFFKKVNGINPSGMIGIHPNHIFTQIHGSSVSWTHKALAWASDSILSPQNLLNDQLSIENLDQLLRSDLGLSTPSSSKLKLPIKSTPSDPQLATIPQSHLAVISSSSLPSPNLPQHINQPSVCSHPHSLPLGKEMDNFYNDLVSKQPSPTPLKVDSGHPYHPPSQISKIGSSHYPHNLENLYPSLNPVFVPLDFTHHSSTSIELPIIQSEKLLLHSHPIIPHDLVHNPRSPRFNVEYALADAMSEQNIGGILSSSYDQTAHHPVESSSITSGTSHSLPSTIDSKQFKIYVNQGQLETEVIWVQRQAWSLALIIDGKDRENERVQSEIDQEILLRASHSLLQRFVDSNWLKEIENLQTLPGKSKHRFLVRAPQTGLYVKQSGTQSKWIEKSELWSGKVIEEKELEVGYGIMHFCKDANSENRDQFNHEESFLRTSSGQWLIHKNHAKYYSRHEQSLTGLNSCAGDGPRLESFLILPNGSGTLIEADNELNIDVNNFNPTGTTQRTLWEGRRLGECSAETQQETWPSGLRRRLKVVFILNLEIGGLRAWVRIPLSSIPSSGALLEAFPSMVHLNCLGQHPVLPPA